MQAIDLRGLETLATEDCCVLSHADAPDLCQEEGGADVRDTASNSLQTPLGEGHLQHFRDQ